MSEQTVTLTLLVKLASIAVHADEATSPGGHAYDVAALRSLLADPEVVAALIAMDSQGLLPAKRVAGGPGDTT